MTLTVIGQNHQLGRNEKDIQTRLWRSSKTAPPISAEWR